MTEPVKFGVIGGSGLYNMPGLTDIERVSVDTPFGKPSGDFVIGTLKGKRVAFLPRHGEGHYLTPSTVPSKANIFAFKKLGVRFLIGSSACGSLREEITPGQFVIPTQIYDNTKSERGGRTFFGAGLAAHIDVAQPFCLDLARKVYASFAQVGGTAHKGGTLLVIEGPRFSTRGESEIFRRWGCSVIGMTAAPEAFLAREAEISYATIAHVTDYDVWHLTEAPVTVETVVRTLKHNVERIHKAISITLESLTGDEVFDSHNALKDAIITDKDRVDSAMVDLLRPIVGRYFDA